MNFDRSCVRAVTSDHPGMGKSFYIHQMTKTLRKKAGKVSASFTIPIHGPDVTPDTVMDSLSDHLEDPTCSMYHLDIAPDVSLFGLHPQVLIMDTAIELWAWCQLYINFCALLLTYLLKRDLKYFNFIDTLEDGYSPVFIADSSRINRQSGKNVENQIYTFLCH